MRYVKLTRLGLGLLVVLLTGLAGISGIQTLSTTYAAPSLVVETASTSQTQGVAINPIDPIAATFWFWPWSSAVIIEFVVRFPPGSDLATLTPRLEPVRITNDGIKTTVSGVTQRWE